MEQNKTILIVDDDLTIRETLKIFLKKNGFIILEAENGRSGIELAQMEPHPNLVITDLLMPEEDGLNVLETIKQKFSIPVIIISGVYKKEEIIAENLFSSYDGYFEKPIDLNNLLTAIKAILG